MEAADGVGACLAGGRAHPGSSCLVALTPNVDSVGYLVRAHLSTQHSPELTALPRPDRVAQALVATEDSRFHQMPGIDPISVVRVGLATLSGSSDTGGATLEQQLAKNLYFWLSCHNCGPGVVCYSRGVVRGLGHGPRCGGVLDGQQDRDDGAAALPEDVVLLLMALLPCSPGMFSQVEPRSTGGSRLRRSRGRYDPT